jgi:hypothetical protein
VSAGRGRWGRESTNSVDGETEDLVLVPREDALLVGIEAIHNSVSPDVVDDALALAGGVPKVIFALLCLVPVHPGDLSTAVGCE